MSRLFNPVDSVKGLALGDQKCFSCIANSVPVWVDEFERSEFYVVHRMGGKWSETAVGSTVINESCDFFYCLSVFNTYAAEMTFSHAYVLNVLCVAL